MSNSVTDKSSHDRLLHNDFREPHPDRQYLSGWAFSFLKDVYKRQVLDILADIGLHKELRPFRQDKGLLMALLADMYENIPVIKKDKPSDLNITQKLLQYINDNITGELTAQKMCIRDRDKPLSIAVEELNQGKIKILGDDEEA